MAEYISREAAIEIAMQYCPDDDGSCSKALADLRDMLDEIESIPAADVRPVVLCRNCEHYQADCGWCGYFDIGMDVNDFCSRWKKREES